MKTSVSPGSYLRSWTSRNGRQRGALGQVKEHEVRLLCEVSLAADVSVGVGGVHQLAGVAVRHPPGGDHDPDNQERDEEAETENIRTRPVLDRTSPTLIRVVFFLFLCLFYFILSWLLIVFFLLHNLVVYKLFLFIVHCCSLRNSGRQR